MLPLQGTQRLEAAIHPAVVRTELPAPMKKSHWHTLKTQRSNRVYYNDTDSSWDVLLLSAECWLIDWALICLFIHTFSNNSFILNNEFLLESSFYCFVLFKVAGWAAASDDTGRKSSYIHWSIMQQHIEKNIVLRSLSHLQLILRMKIQDPVTFLSSQIFTGQWSRSLLTK